MSPMKCTKNRSGISPARQRHLVKIDPPFAIHHQLRHVVYRSDDIHILVRPSLLSKDAMVLRMVRVCYSSAPAPFGRAQHSTESLTVDVVHGACAGISSPYLVCPRCDGARGGISPRQGGWCIASRGRKGAGGFEQWWRRSHVLTHQRDVILLQRRGPALTCCTPRRGAGGRE